MHPLECELNALQAETKLLELDRWEKVAELSETDPKEYMRSAHYGNYLNHFDFPPRVRHDVRSALHQLCQNGHSTVDCVLRPFQSIGFAERIGNDAN